jgi:hypothetical protein
LLAPILIIAALISQAEGERKKLGVAHQFGADIYFYFIA